MGVDCGFGMRMAVDAFERREIGRYCMAVSAGAPIV
jgi:hypothetical protein